MTPQSAIKVIGEGRPSDPANLENWHDAMMTLEKVVASRPSLAQMKCRAGSEHVEVLRAVFAEKKIDRPSRAIMTARKTLVRWGCISNGELTDVGQKLLSAKIAAR